LPPSHHRPTVIVTIVTGTAATTAAVRVARHDSAEAVGSILAPTGAGYKNETTAFREVSGGGHGIIVTASGVTAERPSRSDHQTFIVTPYRHPGQMVILIIN
jgi:hypothetical protein